MSQPVESSTQKHAYVLYGTPKIPLHMYPCTEYVSTPNTFQQPDATQHRDPVVAVPCYQTRLCLHARARLRLCPLSPPPGSTSTRPPNLSRSFCSPRTLPPPFPPIPSDATKVLNRVRTGTAQHKAWPPAHHRFGASISRITDVLRSPF